MSDELQGLTVPVRADVSDFMSKFQSVNDKASVVSGNLVAKIDEVMKAQQRLNNAGNSYKNNLFEGQNVLADSTIAKMNKVIQAQEKVSASAKQLSDNIGKNANSDVLVKDVNSLITANGKLNSALINGASNTEKFTDRQNRLSNSLKANNDIFTQFGNHVQTLASLALVMGAIALPSELITRVKELEQAMAGVKQVLPELEHSQNSANAELLNFTKIAGKYGEATLEVIDAGRSWGRMYKDVNVVNLLVSQSAKMATVDNFSLKESVKGLESAMSQFGMKSEEINEVMKNSNRILDVWTKLAHTGGVSAQDLVSGVERAGSTAYQAGVSFEFFNAMLATGVRNTALSGAEIGNSLKSMFINFKTDKAVKEVEKFGISMTQINEKGEKTFRNMQDVILELSLAVQNTDKDTSKLFQSLFGKFQNSKLTSIITDYKQVIEMWQNAVNSANFTDEQVALQLDTITRKMGETRALLDELVAGASNSGLATFIKEQIESINNFLRGLQSVSSNMWGVIGTTVKWTAELYLLTKVCTGVYTSIVAIGSAMAAGTIVKNADTAATVLNTEAKIAATVATTNLSRAEAIASAIRGNIIPLLILGAGAMYSYSESVGEANNKIQKQNDAEAAKFETMSRNAEATKQQSAFIVGLANAYDKQSEALVNAGENTEKGKKIKDEMAFLENKLTEELNKNSDANNQNSENIVQNGKINRSVIDANLKAKEMHSQELARALLQDADNLRADAKNNKEWANSKITNMENEIKMLGILERAYLSYLNFMAGVYNKIADYQEQEANDVDVYAGVSVEKTPEQKQAKLEAAKAYREKATGYTQQRANTYADYVGASQALRNANEQELLSTKIQSDFVAKNTDSSGVITDKPTKEKRVPGANIQAPDDKVNQQYRSSLKHDIASKFNEDKISADKYAMSLDLINLKENVFGVNQDSVSQRQLLMKNRVDDLLATSMEYKEMAGEYEQQAQGIIESNAELKADLDSRKESWKTMTKEQKEAFKEQHKDFMEANKDVVALDEAAERLKVKSSELSREANKTAVDSITKLIADQNAIYNAEFQRNNLDKEHSLLSLGTSYKKEQADVIELTAILKNLTLAKARLQEIEQTQGKDSIAYKQEVVVIDQLNNQIATLDDKYRNVRQGMAKMFDGMMRGTTTFKEFWKNAWYDMMTEAINSIWKVNQAGSQSSFLGQIFGSFFGSRVANTGQFTSGGQVIQGPVMQDGSFISKRETGGPVKAGQPYIVGEKRAELFVPQTDGMIIPDLNMVNRSGSNSSSLSSGTGGETTIEITIAPNFSSFDPAAGQEMFNQYLPTIENHIMNAMQNKAGMRNTIKSIR